jgi:hypothetical protein
MIMRFETPPRAVREGVKQPNKRKKPSYSGGMEEREGVKQPNKRKKPSYSGGWRSVRV